MGDDEQLSPDGKEILRKLDADFAKILDDLELQGRRFLDQLIEQERLWMQKGGEHDT